MSSSSNKHDVVQTLNLSLAGGFGLLRPVLALGCEAQRFLSTIPIDHGFPRHIGEQTARLGSDTKYEGLSQQQYLIEGRTSEHSTTQLSTVFIVIALMPHLFHPSRPLPKLLTHTTSRGMQSLKLSSGELA